MNYLIKSLSISIFVKCFSAILKFISTPLLLTYFGNEMFGLITLAISTNVFLQMIDMGFNIGNIKYLSQWRAKKETYRINSLVGNTVLFYLLIGIINVIVLLFISYFSDNIFSLNENEYHVFKTLIIILSFSSLVNWVFGIATQILRSFDLIHLDEILTLVSNILIFISIVFTIKYNLSIREYFICFAFFSAIIFPIKFFFCRKLFPEIKFKLNFETSTFKVVFYYSVGIFSLSFIQILAKNLRPLILGIRGSSTILTDFRIIEQFCNSVSLLTGSFLAVLLPIITFKKYSNSNGSLNFMVYNGTKYLSVFISFIVFGLISISDQAILIYVGKDFLHLSFWLKLSLFSLLTSHNYVLSSIILAGEKLKPLVRFTFLSFLISSILIWILTKNYGIGAYAISLTTYNLLQILFYYLYYIPNFLEYSTKLIFLSFFKPFTVGIICLLLTYTVGFFVNFKLNLSSLFLKGIIFSVLFICGIFLHVISSEDLKIIRNKL